MSAVAIPIQEHLRIRGGAEHPGTLAQLVPADYDAAAPEYVDVSGLVAWTFRSSSRSAVVELDASSRVSVADEDAGLLQLGPIPPAETITLGRQGVYDITLDGVVIIEGTYQMTPSPSRPDPLPTAPTGASPATPVGLSPDVLIVRMPWIYLGESPTVPTAAITTAAGDTITTAAGDTITTS